MARGVQKQRGGWREEPFKGRLGLAMGAEGLCPGSWVGSDGWSNPRTEECSWGRSGQMGEGPREVAHAKGVNENMVWQM